jgi:hypothetical protein
MRQHDQAERHHPEAEDREKAEKSAADQRSPSDDSTGARARHRNFEPTQDETPARMIKAVAAFGHAKNSSISGDS